MPSRQQRLRDHRFEPTMACSATPFSCARPGVIRLERIL
jgi:hypothetical protein